MNSYILISVAVQKEAEKIIENIENPITENIGQKRIVSGKIAGISVKVVIGGISIINTVQALTAVIENKKPFIIIQTGCGGVFKNHGLKIGDICIAEQEIYADLGIEPDDKDIFIRKLPFYIDNSHNISNIFETDKNLALYAEKILKKKFTVKKGKFITSSIITATDKRAELLSQTFGNPVMENMEGAGAGYIAFLYNIPFLEIRCASNFVGNRDKSGWNLAEAFDKSNEAVLEFINGFPLFIFPTPL